MFPPSSKTCEHLTLEERFRLRQHRFSFVFWFLVVSDFWFLSGNVHEIKVVSYEHFFCCVSSPKKHINSFPLCLKYLLQCFTIVLVLFYHPNKTYLVLSYLPNNTSTSWAEQYQVIAVCFWFPLVSTSFGECL